MTDTVDDDTEFTQLVDATVPRVDLVGRAANGSSGFLLMKQDARGLVDPDVIRDLIGKTADPEPPVEETVTMTGSPGAIAKLIHEAALRKTTEQHDGVAKAEKSTRATNDLPDSDFAYIESGGTKDDEGKTTPRSLRHFPIMDAAHVRNALSRAPQSPFGDKAMPKIRAAAKKFGIEVAKTEEVAKDMELDESADGMDPTVVLATPDEDAAGSSTDPGSPAWEAIDAATARKWTSILSRAKTALGVMSDREALEAATVDPDDACNAMELDDAACAIDYAISVLAPFAVDEQAEADCGDDMAAVGKALAGFDSAPLDTIEALAPIAKAGRALSAANEQAIRDAVGSLQKVLASLPAPTDESGRPVAKTANEETNMPTPVPSEDATAASGQEPAMGTHQAAPKPVAGEPVTDMAKAKGDPQMVVYDQKGRLIGIVDPGDVTPVANSDADAGDDDTQTSDDDTATDTTNAAPAEPTDLTPAPADEVGTPADAVAASDDDVTKAGDRPATTNDSTADSLSEMLKSSLLAAVNDVLAKQSAAQTEQIAKTGDAVLELAELVKAQQDRIRVLEEQPAVPKVFTNGAVPPAQQLRGQDQGAPAIDVAKAREMKKSLYAADAPEQNRIATDMQTAAIARLQEIHQRRA